MIRIGFEKSVRMFHKFSEETLRRRGGNQLGREGVTALSSIESVLKSERLLDGTLLEPMAAFTNLLQSSQLPPEFGDFSFGDALLAIEEAHAILRQANEQRWEFAPELSAETAASLSAFTLGAPPESSDDDPRGHRARLRRFVLDAASTTHPGTAVVSGALSSNDLPLADLAAHFQQLTLNDLDLEKLEQLVRRAVPEQHRERLKLERYDATGSYAAFAEGVRVAVKDATSSVEAEQALSALMQSYDVSAGSAGLTLLEGRADFAVSAMLLSKLGHGYGPCVANALSSRSWDGSSVARPPLLPALTLLTRLVEQHHIHALLRRSNAAVLVSAVSEVKLRPLPNGQSEPASEPHDLLSVERLVERLPKMAVAKAEQSWEWQQPSPEGAEKGSLLTLVEAVLV